MTKRNVAIVILLIILCLVLLTGCGEKKQKAVDLYDDPIFDHPDNVLVCKGADPFVSACRDEIIDEEGNFEKVCIANGKGIITYTYDSEKEHLEKMKIEIIYTKEDDPYYDDAVEYYHDMCDEETEGTTCTYTNENDKMVLILENESVTLDENTEQKTLEQLKQKMQEVNESYKNDGFEAMVAVCK